MAILKCYLLNLSLFLPLLALTSLYINENIPLALKPGFVIQLETAYTL
jgi:hypothetical protein